MVGGGIPRVKECQLAVAARGVGEASRGRSHRGCLSWEEMDVKLSKRSFL